MTRDQFMLIAAVIALFSVGFTAAAQVHYAIVAVPSPVEGGTVDGAGMYPAGANVSLTARPYLGYRFDGWMEDGAQVSTSPTLAFTAERDRELTAEFSPIPLETQIGGRWHVDMQLLPGIAVSGSRLELGATLSNSAVSSDLRSTVTFAASGWTGLSARAAVRWGGWQANAGISFDSTSYRSAYFTTSWDLLGLYWSLYISHYAAGGGTSAPQLLYALSARSDKFSITARADSTDCCLSFRDLSVSLNPCAFSLCGGAFVQASLLFTRDEGFSYLQVMARDIAELWNVISLDANLRFTPTANELTVTPRWTEWGNVRLRLYGNVEWDGGRLSGLDLYGFKLRCCLDCESCPGARISSPYMEFLTGFDPTHVPGGFRGDEFEYWKAGFCGPASCCTDGFYTVETTAYFSHASVSLFDLSRLMIAVTYPLFDGFTFDVHLELDVPGGPTMDVGWDWTF